MGSSAANKGKLFEMKFVLALCLVAFLAITVESRINNRIKGNARMHSRVEMKKVSEEKFGSGSSSSSSSSSEDEEELGSGSSSSSSSSSEDEEEFGSSKSSSSSSSSESGEVLPLDVNDSKDILRILLSPRFGVWTRNGKAGKAIHL